jgi:hypothetical protein
VDHETLRRWMLADGLWSRMRKRSLRRRRRERKAHFGELVQMNGSFHPSASSPLRHHTCPSPPLVLAKQPRELFGV